MPNSFSKVLVTGGAGYIGSHTCLELIQKGYNVIVVDNLANGKIEALNRIEKITNVKLTFYQKDLRNIDSLKNVFRENNIQSVIHFAGYKAVGESVQNPLLYYDNNVLATINLLRVMQEFEVENLVFSSSCTVYGKPENVPVKEGQELRPNNPYGRSKKIVEDIIEDFFISSSSLSVSILRYFNPIGAHPTGIIGEDPKGIPNNLLPYISKVASGKLTELKVFGDNYETEDGTGVRDYIHVVDLAKAHILALEELWDKHNLFEIYNLGTGKGYSVLEVIEAFYKVSGKEIPYKITQRRPGDIGAIYADPSKANTQLGWYAEKSLMDMCNDMWNWEVKNPDGI